LKKFAIYARAPEELRFKLKIVAAQMGKSVQDIVVEAVFVYLQNFEKKQKKGK